MNEKIIENFICTAPWEGLFIDPDGDFRVCCAGKSLGNLNKTSLDDLIKNGELTNVQNDILTKGHSTYCTACMEAERIQGRSLRGGYGTDLSKIDTTKFIPRILDVRWKNACQLRCLYCNSEWSTTYAQWEGKTYRVSERNWQNEILQYISENKPEEITRVYLLGGEPFILKENDQLLDMIPDDSDCIVAVITNLAIPDMHTLPLYDKIIQKSSSILVSLENVGNKFHYVRRNGKWKELEENYKILKERKLQGKPNEIGFHMTYNLLSAFSLVETFDWIHSMHPDKNDNKTVISILLAPETFNIHNYPREIKQLAIDEFNRLEEKYGHWLEDVQKQFIATTRQSLIDNMDTYNLQFMREFMEYVKRTDEGMGSITFANEWPEINSIIKDYLK